MELAVLGAAVSQSCHARRGTTTKLHRSTPCLSLLFFQIECPHFCAESTLFFPAIP
jgi:hypothetical protein